MSRAVVLLGATLPLILSLFPNHTLALSEHQRYDVGWQIGISQAQYDWINNLPYDPLFPSHHTNYFCLGFNGGYNHWWDGAQQPSNQQETEQNSKVDIRGNGNHVTVDQQSNDQVGDNRDGGQAGGSINPRCTILCANIRIK